MKGSEKEARLRQLLFSCAGDRALGDLVSAFHLGAGGWELSAEEGHARAGVLKLTADPAAELSASELHGLEAIVLRRLRPVSFVRGRGFDRLASPWTHLNEAPIRQRLGGLFASVGRIEVPSSPLLPFAGTGFVVGRDLVMTNRHVARCFAGGVAAINFAAEVDAAADVVFPVREVALIHPSWDLALLRVDPLPPERPPLVLGVRDAAELFGRDVVVIGYPALDRRGDIRMQNRIFGDTYDVKRLQPGKIRGIEGYPSAGRAVRALTHDCSTLGGNSGSALCDVETGEVVGLHFAGLHLCANYAVPMAALVGDPHLAAFGVCIPGAAAQA